MKVWKGWFQHQLTLGLDGSGDRAGKTDAVVILSSNQEHVRSARLKISDDEGRLKDLVRCHDPALWNHQYRTQLVKLVGHALRLQTDSSDLVSI